MSGMPWLPEAVALLTAAGAGGIITKIMNRPVDQASAEKMHAETRKSVQDTAASEVATIRDVLAEVRTAELAKNTEITALKTDMLVMKARLDKLEERERHMLTRAAVHEAWDQMAFAALLAHNPEHPPPPPLMPSSVHRDDIPDFENPP